MHFIIEGLMTDTNYSTFVSRTAELHRAVATHASRLQFPGHPRIVLSFKAGSLSMQLAAGALRLVLERNIYGAMALIRPQFECLVRGMWLMYVANDEWIAKLSQPLTVETAKQASKAPMLAEMLGKLGEATEPRLLFIVKQLHKFHEMGKAVLNSFTRGGMVPLARVGAEYPQWMVLSALQNSNVVLALTRQLLTVLTGDEKNMLPVRKIHYEFTDYLRFERGDFELGGKA